MKQSSVVFSFDTAELIL